MIYVAVIAGNINNLPDFSLHSCLYYYAVTDQLVNRRRVSSTMNACQIMTAVGGKLSISPIMCSLRYDVLSIWGRPKIIDKFYRTDEHR